MRKLMLWFVSKTKLGQLLNGNKRIIGFVLIAASYLIELLGVATQTFPEVGWLEPIRRQALELYEPLAEALRSLGIPVMAVGVWHAAEKEKEE